MTRIVVHGHFYQPPREDPATGAVPVQPGAAPFHDWNERVHAECYRPNARVLIPDPGGAEREVNNFERISFNVGPTLMAWMEQADPDTYSRILDGDRASGERLGHGNAIAQAFHHTILPLSPLRDVRTQIRWGLADFRHRFGREAGGMWAPETAVNHDVLDAMIEEGVGFTILAHHQAQRWREPGGAWREVEDDGLDPRRAYLYRHRDGSGRSLTLMFYDGGIARAIAFERAGTSAQTFIDLFEAAGMGAGADMIVHAATDGETYGHHHKFSDLGLAYALYVEAQQRGHEVTNYETYLAGHPAEFEVDVVDGRGTSWSCAHGVGRWAMNCGCSTGGEPGWNQTWRAPLRAALDVLRAAADDSYIRLGRRVFADPRRARDRYVDVVIGARGIDELLAEELIDPERGADLAPRLLQMQTWAMEMYTSCGWFFNDIGGVETVQVLRYAAAVIGALQDLGEPVPMEDLLTLLEAARSNDPSIGTGVDVFKSIQAERLSGDSL